MFDYRSGNREILCQLQGKDKMLAFMIVYDIPIPNNFYANTKVLIYLQTDIVNRFSGDLVFKHLPFIKIKGSVVEYLKSQIHNYK